MCHAAFPLDPSRHPKCPACDNGAAIFFVHLAPTAPLADEGRIDIAETPVGVRHNGHLFWVKAADAAERASLLDHLDAAGVHATFHYVPLHSAPAGRRFGRFAGDDVHTTRESERLLRLPLFFGLNETDRVAAAVRDFYAG